MTTGSANRDKVILALLAALGGGGAGRLTANVQTDVAIAVLQTELSGIKASVEEMKKDLKHLLIERHTVAEEKP